MASNVTGEHARRISMGAMDMAGRTRGWEIYIDGEGDGYRRRAERHGKNRPKSWTDMAPTGWTPSTARLPRMHFGRIGKPPAPPPPVKAVGTLWLALLLFAAATRPAAAQAQTGDKSSLIETYWQLAQSHFASGNFSQTLEYLDKFVPSNEDAKGQGAYYNLRGVSRVALGDVIGGQNDLERAIQLDQSQASYYGDLILPASKMKEKTRAREVAKQAKTKFPQDAKLQILIVQVFDEKTAASPP